MQKILEVAKSFEQHAKQQNEAIEMAVRAEFERLKSVIEQESSSAQSTYTRAIRNLNQRHWTQSTLHALPLTVLVMFSTLATSAAWSWYVFGSQNRHLANIEETTNEGKWAACRKIYEVPKKSQDDTYNQTYCLLLE